MAIELSAPDRAFEPLPPHNTEAEESVLGSLLIDPEAVDRMARADQAAMIERVGGKERIKKRGAIHHTPPPGVAATLTPVERAD